MGRLEGVAPHDGSWFDSGRHADVGAKHGRPPLVAVRAVYYVVRWEGGVVGWWEGEDKH